MLNHRKDSDSKEKTNDHSSAYGSCMTLFGPEVPCDNNQTEYNNRRIPVKIVDIRKDGQTRQHSRQAVAIGDPETLKNVFGLKK